MQSLDLTDEIEKIETTITEMTAFDPSKSVIGYAGRKCKSRCRKM